MSSGPIENGALAVSNGRISQVGAWTELISQVPAGVEVIDLGEVVLLPGFVNSHCHLDYTCMAGQLVPTRSFSSWIKSIMTLKGGLIYADFASSWVAGARMLLASGVTSVGDIESVPELLPEVWDASPLRVTSFLEMTGVKSRRDPRLIITDALEHVDRLSGFRGSVGLSPHAPYSTSAELLKAASEVGLERRLKTSVHISESVEEFEMFMNSRGELFDWLQKNARDNSDCKQQSPVRVVADSGLLGPDLLAIHCNYLHRSDFDLLGSSRTHVVHCPRSHEFFGHQPFPYAELRNAGVNVSIGTDSLATVRREGKELPRLDMLKELQVFAKNHPKVEPAEIIRMATLNGAAALDIPVGRLEAGYAADLIAIPIGTLAGPAVEEFVVNSGTHPSCVMIDGVWNKQPEGYAVG